MGNFTSPTRSGGYHQHGFLVLALKSRIPFAHQLDHVVEGLSPCKGCTKVVSMVSCASHGEKRGKAAGYDFQHRCRANNFVERAARWWLLESRGMSSRQVLERPKATLAADRPTRITWPRILQVMAGERRCAIRRAQHRQGQQTKPYTQLIQ